MPAYFIVQNTIKDEAQYQKYVQTVVPFIATFGGQLVARRASEHGCDPRVLELPRLRPNQEAAPGDSHTKHLGLRGLLIGLSG
jgi:hypothetical protein